MHERQSAAFLPHCCIHMIIAKCTSFCNGNYRKLFPSENLCELLVGNKQTYRKRMCGTFFCPQKTLHIFTRREEARSTRAGLGFAPGRATCKARELSVTSPVFAVFFLRDFCLR